MGTHIFRCDFIQNRLFKQGKKIKWDRYLMHNSHILNIIRLFLWAESYVNSLIDRQMLAFQPNGNSCWQFHNDLCKI